MFAALFVTAPRPVPVPVPTPAPDTHVGTMAWLLPIMLGLLLTAVACYKHRGLPGGH